MLLPLAGREFYVERLRLTGRETFQTSTKDMAPYNVATGWRSKEMELRASKLNTDTDSRARPHVYAHVSDAIPRV